ncbi:MAG TPA: Fmu (Sun) domain-containing protein [Flavitalea sp.]|nr:Fmu (Sun) domain-containing protein [Flavitalea sp.]
MPLTIQIHNSQFYAILQSMKFFSHLNTTTRLIQEYNGEEPLHYFLKRFFGHNKKFGSKDRKRISHMSYVFFRVGRAFQFEGPLKEAEDIHRVILAGLFLSGNESDDLLAAMRPSWNEKMAVGTGEKLEMINEETPNTHINIANIFPSSDRLSDGIEKLAFSLSHLFQPDLFIRIRPGYQHSILEKLKRNNIQYEILPGSAVRLPNGLGIDEIVDLDREVVVQDLSSQQVGDFLFDYRAERGEHSSDRTNVWDCCAASGGKSIMAKDILGNIDLTVSDVRESILINLKKRFEKAGLTNYNIIVADLSRSIKGDLYTGQAVTPFDLIIADLPCTGSGTWSRTPEQLYFFQPEAIQKYSQLQKSILGNVVPHLKETGKLLYITCSVFRQENEEIIDFLLDRFPLKLERMELLKGYDKKADTMFAALLSKL